ncbi:MAG: 4-(cytidine 5'-diphospho)-2-C-methyl-D-erythritol kinase, partial [Rhodospirillales bacterium]|nr:4-(cytidine 5'-diphospho)-2-C-methyl-D-erythritol kinase [Rhodospirillales bacterium]
MPAAIRVGAPAKLNLYLHVTGRRADGYHELDSLVTFTSLADTLEIAPADSPSLTVRGPFADALDAGDNLAARAAAALAERTGRPAGVRITLDKRIPVAAGLGGGSADAAAVLRGLARL